jgi:CBS domain-containing protein
MSHTVRDWMSTPVIVVDQDSSVAYAMRLMRRRNIRSLVVNLKDDPTHFGILTATDIRDRIVAADRNPSEITVGEIMTVQLVTAQEDWTLKECSINMQKNHINHLPVLDKDSRLVGMISTTDLFIAAEEIGWEDEF